MKKILFVCMGNICRSPSAEMILEHMLKKIDKEKEFYINSAGVSDEEMGMPIYPLSRQKLIEKGIPVDETFRARRFIPSDYDTFDFIIAMETANVRGIKNIIGEDIHNKVSRLLDYTDEPGDIADPWYTRDFEVAYNDINKGCQGLFEFLTK